MMNLKRVWKKRSCLMSRRYSGIRLEVLRNTIEHLRIIGVPAELKPEHLPNVSHSALANLLDNVKVNLSLCLIS
jgi:hypothetical protein